MGDGVWGTSDGVWETIGGRNKGMGEGERKKREGEGERKKRRIGQKKGTPDWMSHL